MTAIRKTSLQVAYFQGFTNLTTDLCTSNDRFGLNDNTESIFGNLRKFEIGTTAAAKYNFDCGLFLGLDGSVSATSFQKDYRGRNSAFNILVGFRF